MTTTQLNLVELAKQGDTKAIAALINRHLQPRGVVAKAAHKDDCLYIKLESAQLLGQQALMAFIRKGMMSLAVPSIAAVKVYGLDTGQELPAWSEEFELPNVSAEISDPTSVPSETVTPETPAAIPTPLTPEDYEAIIQAKLILPVSIVAANLYKKGLDGLAKRIAEVLDSTETIAAIVGIVYEHYGFLVLTSDRLACLTVASWSDELQEKFSYPLAEISKIVFAANNLKVVTKSTTEHRLQYANATTVSADSTQKAVQEQFASLIAVESSEGAASKPQIPGLLSFAAIAGSLLLIPTVFNLLSQSADGDVAQYSPELIQTCFDQAVAQRREARQTVGLSPEPSDSWKTRALSICEVDPDTFGTL